MIKLLIYDSETEELIDGKLEDIIEWDRESKKIAWLDIDNIDKESADFIQNSLWLHPLAIESCFNEKALPKVEVYEKSCFVIFDAVNFNPGYRALDFIKLYGFLGDNFLVTVHNKPLRSVKQLAERIIKKPKMMESGADNILYELLDTVVSYYFPIIDQFDETITELEDRVFHKFDNVKLEEIFRIKKDLISLRRSTNPQRDILSELSSREIEYITPKTKTYFRDVFHHVWRIADTIDTYRDLLTGALESYMTILSNRMNDVMKTLSVVATIMLPLTVLTGIFGMNFEYMPGLTYKIGFYVMMIVMLVIIGFMAYYFKKKHWF
ncbi:MAG: magnesium/cobalt transporter CorA [candidate division Zixibacteria bacterium]|nr:magnesium/cobalt transporter CorA [candidate division Zixibacteria bacterium]